MDRNTHFTPMRFGAYACAAKLPSTPICGFDAEQLHRSSSWWSLPDKPAEGKRLDASGWRLMSIVHALGKLEVRSELRCNGGRIVAFDWHAAALRRSVETERRDDRGTSDFERSSQMRDVRVAPHEGNSSIGMPATLNEFCEGSVSRDHPQVS